MRGYLYQYTKFELITIIEQYEEYVKDMKRVAPHSIILTAEEFVDKLWEKEEEPRRSK